MEKYPLGAWNLQEIKPPSFKHAKLSIERKAKLLENKRKLLTNTIPVKTFLSIVTELEIIRKEMERWGVYAQLRFSEDSANQSALAELSQTENILTKINNRLLFLALWFKQLPDYKMKQLIEGSGNYRYFFETLRRNKKYTLKENEEKIINLKDSTGVSALNNIYSLLTTDFQYHFQGQSLTQEELITHVRSSQPKIRELAYRTLLFPYQQKRTLIGEIYKNVVNDWREENIGLRGYHSPLNVRNSVNDIPDQAIAALLKTCKKNQPLFHRFFEIKRKKLGLKKFRRFDLYAPLDEEKKTISYDQAVKLVLETFQEFSPKFAVAARNIIDLKHVHSQVQKGKRSGAFCCPATTEVAPFVLLSYTGKYRDVSTLAHELGHGVHMTLAQQQTEFTMDACLPLAETASIFSEMLLSEKVMKDNSQMAQSMIFTQLDDLYASIIRQAGLVSFEVKAHQMMKDGKTIDDLSEQYLKDIKTQLGPVEIDDIFAHEWLYIPHIFHTPFYCYAYAFGNLLTLALYNMYLKDKTFSSQIITMLAAGGSKSPPEITKAIGVDITSEKFWQQGFEMIARMIEKIE